MHPLADNLRRRANELGISNSEAARRAGLDERRYGNYVTGAREPDLATLVAISKALHTTPDELLGIDAVSIEDAQRREIMHLLAKLDEYRLRLLLLQIRAWSMVDTSNINTRPPAS